MRVGRWVACAAGACLLTASVALAADTAVEQRLAELETLVKAQAERIQELEQQKDSDWLDAAKQEQVRELVTEVLADARAKGEGEALTAGYKKGFYIKSADDAFLCTFGARLQFRYTGLNVDGGWSFYDHHGDPEGDNDRNDFEVERGKLYWSGHLFDKNLTYKIQLDASTDTDGPAVLDEWYVDYKFDPALVLRAGQFKAAQGQQELTSSGDLQFVDRSLANEAFNLDKVMGLMLHGTLLENVRPEFMKYAVGIYNGFDTDNVTSDGLDTNMATSARLEFFLMGEKAGNLKDEPDLKKLEEPHLRMGMHYGFNDMNEPEDRHRFMLISDRNWGVQGIDRYHLTGTEYHQFGYDFRFKWQGLSVSGEHFIRAVDHDKTYLVMEDLEPMYILSDFAEVTASRDCRHYQGGYLQAGYFISEDLPIEPVLRIGGMWDNDEDNAWEVAAGCNWYIHGHNLKLSVDWTRVAENFAHSSAINIPDNADANMVRAQLQVKF